MRVMKMTVAIRHASMMVPNSPIDRRMSVNSRKKGMQGRKTKKVRAKTQKQICAGGELSFLYALLLIVSWMARLVRQTSSSSCGISISSVTCEVENSDPTLRPSASKTNSGLDDEQPIFDTV